jgi:uncharacterized membrane protein
MIRIHALASIFATLSLLKTYTHTLITTALIFLSTTLIILPVCLYEYNNADLRLLPVFTVSSTKQN